jgi:aspartate aminotransferase
MLDLANEVKRIKDSGRQVVDLSLGQPDVPPPSHISGAMRDALASPVFSYSDTAGVVELRSLIAKMYAKSSGAQTDSSNVVVTPGSKHALFVSFLSLLDPGDEVLCPEPYFPPYAEISALVGAKLTTVPVKWAPDSVRLDLDRFLDSATRRTKVILLNYPNNPVGWTLRREEVRRVAEFCSEKGVYLVSDEIYDRIVFDGLQHCTSWAFSQGTDRIVSIGSFSKTYSMISYRLGYFVAAKSLAREMLKAVRATVTMVNPYVQQAGCAALTGPQGFVASRLAKYQWRRDRCLRILNEKGIYAPSPAGAFYLFIEVPSRWAVSDLVKTLLHEDGVAVLPGEAFGKRWRQFVRVSLGTSDSDLFTGMRALARRCQPNQ